MKNSNSRALELTIISGESLSLAGKRSIKKNTYVVINTQSNSHPLQLATAMDPENGSYPSWNHKFFIHIPTHMMFFTLQVRCRNFSGDHVVGSARVPLSDFTGRYFPGNYLHFLSYRLRDRYGERNGIINISIKMKSPDYNISSGATSSTSMVYLSPATGWKYGGATMGEEGESNGMVIGVPVQNRY